MILHPTFYWKIEKNSFKVIIEISNLLAVLLVSMFLLANSKRSVFYRVRILLNWHRLLYPLVLFLKSYLSSFESEKVSPQLQ